MILDDAIRGAIKRLLTTPPPSVAKPKPVKTGSAYSDARPLKSRSAGCHPSQVGELREFLKKSGVRGTEVQNSGRVHFTARGGRADYNRATGTFDGDAGYSDHAGS